MADAPLEDDPERDEVEAELERIQAELARRSLKEFVRQAWELVEPAQPLRWNWHLDLLCEELEKVSNGETTRLIINIPPGTMKSLLVSVFWPAWEWTRDPTLGYLTASYGARLSLRDSVRVRTLVNSDWYHNNFGITIVGEQKAKELFKNSAGGWRFATSVGGAGTGEHPDRIIVDDPHSAKQARSEVERKSACDWHDQTLSTRGVARGVREVVIMQRLHEEDLTGHLLAKGEGGWRHVRLPMFYEADPGEGKRPNGWFPPHPQDPRKENGELLWPELLPKKKIDEIALELGPYGVAGQFQQRPAPEGGGLFKRAWFKIVDVAPATGGVSCRGWDTAASEKRGDWTAGVRMRGPIDGIFYVENVVRGQWEVHDQEKIQGEVIKMDGKACRQREEQEPGAAGKATIARKVRMFAGYDYGPSPTTGDKIVRARGFRAQAQAGNVCLVRGHWNDAYLAELEMFPNGRNDDQVDASSAAFNEIATGPQVIKQIDLGWG